MAGFIIVFGMVAYWGQPGSEIEPGVALLQYEEPSEPERPPRCGDGECNGDESWDTCPMDCGYCGDGFCGYGETALNCPDCFKVCGDGICTGEEGCEACPTDCGECGPVVSLMPVGATVIIPTTPAPPPPPPPVVRLPTDTPEPEETPEDTETPATEEPSTPTPTQTSTPIPTPAPCALVPYESRGAGWMEAYAGFALPGDYIPVQVDDLEVYVCDEPPSGRVCIPLYSDILDTVQDDLEHIVLLDCHEGEGCTSYYEAVQRVGDGLCFDVSPEVDPLCDEGCAWAPVLNCRIEGIGAIADSIQAAFVDSTGAYLAFTTGHF